MRNTDLVFSQGGIKPCKEVLNWFLLFGKILKVKLFYGNKGKTIQLCKNLFNEN